MTYEQFEHCHLKGWKLKKILEYLDVVDFEAQEAKSSFKKHFSTKMAKIKLRRTTSHA